MSFSVFVPLWFLLHLCLLSTFSLNMTSLLWENSDHILMVEEGRWRGLRKEGFFFFFFFLIAPFWSCRKSLGQSWVPAEFERREECKWEDELTSDWLCYCFWIIPILSISLLLLNSNNLSLKLCKAITSREKSGLRSQCPHWHIWGKGESQV